MEYYQVLIPCVSLVIYVGTQIILARYLIPGKLFHSVMSGLFLGIGCLLGFICLGGFLQEMPFHEWVGLLVADLICYIAFAFCYFNLINLGETSIRIRLFLELKEAKNGLTAEEILAIYNYRQIILMRLSRLQNNKQIIEKDGRFFLQSRTLWFIAKLVRILKVIVIPSQANLYNRQGNLQAGP
jgi:hypothetical protein